MRTALKRRAVSYGRNSSAKQKSINDQAADNRAAIASNGWVLATELSDPVSASRYAKKVRENWAALLAMLATVDVVVFWEPSRGDRTLASWAAFLDSCREHGVLIHATSHHRTYDPKVARDYRSLAEDGVDSAYESDKISERTVRGKAASAKLGRPQGPVPYGYVRIYDPLTKAYVREDENPDEARIVREVFRRALDGEPITAIARSLHESGEPRPAGTMWRHQNIWRILTTRRYVAHPDDPTKGIASHLGEEFLGTWPALVDEAQWQEAQRILAVDDPKARAARRWSAPGAVKYLLSGSAELLCAPCGAPVSGRPGKPGHQAPNYACIHDGCVGVPMADADEYVTRLVVARLSRRDARRVIGVVDTTAAKAARAELARLEGQLAEALRLYVADQMSATAYTAKEAALKPQIEDARLRSRSVGAPLGALKLLDAAKVAKELVRPTWDALELLAKREVVAGLFVSLVLHPADPAQHITRWTPAEDRLGIVSDRIEHTWRR